MALGWATVDLDRMERVVRRGLPGLRDVDDGPRRGRTPGRLLPAASCRGSPACRPSCCWNRPPKAGWPPASPATARARWRSGWQRRLASRRRVLGRSADAASVGRGRRSVRAGGPAAGRSRPRTASPRRAGRAGYHHAMTDTAAITLRPATADDAEAIAALFTDEGYPAGPSDIADAAHPVHATGRRGHRRRARGGDPRVRRQPRDPALRARRCDRPDPRPGGRRGRARARRRAPAHRRCRADRRLERARPSSS